MDRLLDNPWFLRIIALLLAVLLYSAVPHTSGKTTDINVPGEESSAILEDIPVKAYYDTENLVVSGIPDTVQVTIEGPMPHVQSAKALKNFEVFVDLTDAKIGTQKVKFEVREISDKLKATIKPTSVTVSIQEKVTKEFKVEAEFNSSLIEEGYTAGTPVVEPNKVKITGAKDVIDRITYVKATVEGKDLLKETITREAQVRVLDKELNKLDVMVEPETVEVTVPVKHTSKTVPIKIVENGSLPAGVELESIKLDIDEAVITGEEEVIEKTENVRVEVDLSKITDDTTLTLPVIISNGITKVTPQTVKATVSVKKQEEKTVSGVPINIKGLNEQYEAVIHEPANQALNILVSGPSGSLDVVGPDDFAVFIDISGLAEGNHDVNIQIEGPSNISWKPERSLAKITITRVNA